MQIRMLKSFTYPLDEAGSVERTLPHGLVFDEDEAVAQAAIDAGCAEHLDEEPHVADAEPASTDEVVAPPAGKRARAQS